MFVEEGEVFCEIRWLYQSDELKTACLQDEEEQTNSGSIWNVDNIYETDHTDVIPGESIFSHVFIIGTQPRTLEEFTRVSAVCLPVGKRSSTQPQYWCRSFFSHRGPLLARRFCVRLILFS